MDTDPWERGDKELPAAWRPCLELRVVLLNLEHLSDAALPTERTLSCCRCHVWISGENTSTAAAGCGSVGRGGAACGRDGSCDSLRCGTHRGCGNVTFLTSSCITVPHIYVVILLW